MLLNPDLLLAYLAVATLLALSPGPDTMFVLASSASGGARSGVAATLGIASGGVVHASAAALGISALIAASPLAFEALRLGGALYLAWIGAQALYRLRRGRDAATGSAGTVQVSAGTSYRRGLVTNVLNPKVAIFYVAFLPQFADPALGHVPLQIFLLCAMHNAIGTSWLMGLALASGRMAQAFVRNARVRAWLDGTAGAVYLILAARIVLLSGAQLEEGWMSSLDYAGYLKLSQLLSAQEPESGNRGAPAHDEMLFIVIHQAYELWFKQILYELDLIQSIFGGAVVDDADLGRAVHAAERIVRIEQLLVSQIDILETMTPMDFLEFRNLLMPASGFQSEQFRLIEVRLGLKRDARLAFDGASFDARLNASGRAHVLAAEARPSLRDQIDGWLSRTPFVDMGGYRFRETYDAALNAMLAQDMELIRNHAHLSQAEKDAQLASLQKSRTMLDGLLDEKRFGELRSQGVWTMSRRSLQAALFLFLYRDEPAANAGYRMLNALMDMDETLALWRLRHALMVSRMLGRKVGTGGSSGYDYLRATADKHRAYDDLFAIATFLIPRSALPKLPDDVRKSMRYRYES